jgi:hydroxymethylglutaryl-CoA lyase/(R)-citramalyl-CoA lyase
MVCVCDVAPRDGLQNEALSLPPAVRAKLVNRLAGAGVSRIEAVSFVHSGWVPQMAGAEAVMAAVELSEAVTYAALVLNERGYDLLQGTPVAEVRFAFGCTETFNGRNSNASVAESAAACGRVISRARRDGRRAAVTLAVAFGCPFEGAVDPGRVLALVEEMVAAGADEIIFADTIGVAVPRQVRALVVGARSLGVAVGVHLHNTRNTGLANAYAAVEAGVGVIDASVGGTGGCPYAPKATGNIPTEDLVYLLHGEGIETGIDLAALCDVSRWLAGVLGRELPGQVTRAGLFAPVSG